MPIRLFSLIILALSIVSPAVAEPMVVNTYLKPPLGTNDGSGQFDLVVKEAFRRIEQPLTWKWVPGKRGIMWANNGVHDGHYSRISAVTKEYKNLIIVPRPLYRSNHIAVTKDPNIHVKGWESLKNFRVAFPMHWKVFSTKTSFYGLSEQTTTPESTLKMLEAGRVDVALFEYSYLQKMSKDLNITGLIVQRPALSIDEVYLLLNKKHTSTMHKLADALQGMTNDGTFAKLCPICMKSLSVDLR